jgi:hypothetical protein
MKPRIAAHLSMIVMAISFVSFRWPVNNGTITSTFGESRWDHFHDGIDITSADDKVYPVESGTLLFYWDKAIFPLENYPGGGNYKVLEHRNGMFSIYMHLENGISSQKMYTSSDMVGMMGNTGHSGSKHLHFSMLYPAKRVSINPMKLMPAKPDTKAPVISDIAFHIGDKYIIVRDKSNIRLTRHYPLLIKITDSMVGRENLGIYHLALVFNGKKVAEREFKAISFSKGKLVVGGKGFDSLFDKKGYYKIEGLTYVDGENVLKITASDFAGNKSEREFAFNVKLDISKE